MSRLANRSDSERDEYMELIQEFPLKPIHTDEDSAAAIEFVDKLLDCCGLSEDAEEYLEVLTGLIEKYELDNERVPEATDAEVLRHLMDARGVKATELARETGIVASTISDVLHGNRVLTRDHIGRLAKYFRVAPTVFSFERS